MEIFTVLECIGIASAALSGFWFGIKHNCDWLGIFISSFLTALGGGIIRDVLVDRPIYSFTHYLPVIIVIVVIFLSRILNLHKNQKDKKFFFILTDAIDFVCFSIVGAIVASEYGYNIFGVMMIAFANGVGGGILRDVLLNEVPWFLSTGLYGTISMLIGILYYLLTLFTMNNITAILLLLIFGIFLRLIAYYRGWKLPDIN